MKSAQDPHNWRGWSNRPLPSGLGCNSASNCDYSTDRRSPEVPGAIAADVCDTAALGAAP